MCFCVLLVCGCSGWFVWVVRGFDMCLCFFACMCLFVVLCVFARTTQDVSSFASVGVLAHACGCELQHAPEASAE